jgi:hypothetical protein
MSNTIAAAVSIHAVSPVFKAGSIGFLLVVLHYSPVGVVLGEPRVPGMSFR